MHRKWSIRSRHFTPSRITLVYIWVFHPFTHHRHWRIETGDLFSAFHLFALQVSTCIVNPSLHSLPHTPSTLIFAPPTSFVLLIHGLSLVKLERKLQKWQTSTGNCRVCQTMNPYHVPGRATLHRTEADQTCWDLKALLCRGIHTKPHSPRSPQRKENRQRRHNHRPPLCFQYFILWMFRRWMVHTAFRDGRHLRLAGRV